MMSPRTSEVYKTESGKKFRGTFSEPQSTFSDDESLARRILHVESYKGLATGDIVRAHDTEYLLFAHSAAGFQRRFLAYQITERVVWSKMVPYTNPVTRMSEGKQAEVQNESFPIMHEPVSIKDEVNLERVKFRLRCPLGPAVGDKLGDLTVHTLKVIDGALLIEAF